MMTIVFAATTIICVLGWLKWKITALSLAYYITKNQYPDPNEKEMREYHKKAWMGKEITSSPLAFDKDLSKLTRKEFLTELEKYVS